MGLSQQAQLIELASGIDSFYLSGKGWLPEPLVSDLEQGRAEARATEAPTPFRVGTETFRIGSSGMNRYPYRLDHERGVIAFTTSASLPTVVVQPRASFLHGVGVREALAWFADVVEMLIGRVAWKASRVDLFMDSHGWQLASEDRGRFLCRAKQTTMYEDDAAFRTLVFGTSKAGVKARIYDKSEESRKKGTDWWPLVWGQNYQPAERVLRVEFQVNREGLRQSNIDSPEDALNRLPELWGYLTDSWLTLREPTEDETRSRWPVSPEWQQIQRASLRGDAAGLSRVSSAARAGSLRKLMPGLRGYVASYGALLGAETLDETLRGVRRHLIADEATGERGFSAVLAEKRLAVGL